MAHALLDASMFLASVLSEMLGVSVAFAAVPILGISGMDLVNGIQPIALFLNGVTALFSAVFFARAGLIDWQRSYQLAIVVSIFSPLGACAAEWVPVGALWDIYFVAVAFIAYQLLNDRATSIQALPFAFVVLISVPVSAVSGLLGVGPGILLVPVMTFLGFAPKSAAALNAVAVAPASFLSLIPHLEHASIDAGVALPLMLATAGGALLGAYLSNGHGTDVARRRLFVIAIIALCMVKALH